MKNDFCDLPQEKIHKLPERFKGCLLSHFHRADGTVVVPETTFKEMIDLITEYAISQRNAVASSPQSPTLVHHEFPSS